MKEFLILVYVILFVIGVGFGNYFVIFLYDSPIKNKTDELIRGILSLLIPCIIGLFFPIIVVIGLICYIFKIE